MSLTLIDLVYPIDHYLQTSTVTTTTISTTGACYTTAAAITTSCSKKKRSIIDTGPIQASLKNPKIFPALTQIIEEEEKPEIVGFSVNYSRNEKSEKSLDLSKLQELNQVADVKMGTEEVIQPRFIDQYLYWFTTTTTSTFTSYTKTTTFTISGCTPAGGDFEYSACG